MGASRRRTGTPSEGGKGGRWRPARAPLAVAAFLVLAGLVLLAGGAPTWGTASTDVQPATLQVAAATAAPVAADPAPMSPSAGSVVEPEPAPMPAQAAGERALPRPVLPRAIPRMREPDSDPSPDLADFVNPGEVPTMAEVIERLRRAGVTGGLAAFSPPGTRPPLVGLAVPEQFELPPGYVRHHQATDDGQDIEPILMYSPDVQWVDAAGRPVAPPADRVVPPEHAPPGLPLRRIVVPAPLQPGSVGR